MRRLAVIINPNAHGNSKVPGRLADFQKRIGDAGEVHLTNHTSDLPTVCRDLAASDCDLIGICGGDGTNHLVITDLIKAYESVTRPLPAIVFLRGGSMNTIGWNVGVRKNAEESIDLLVRKIRDGGEFKTIPLGTMKINDRYGFFYGNGYAANWLKEYYGNTKTGAMRAVETTMQSIASVLTGKGMFERIRKQFDADVTIDGVAVPFYTHGMIFASCIEYIGILFRPLYRARERADRFHVIDTALLPKEILFQLNRFFIGKPMRGRCHVDTLAQQMEIRATCPLTYTIDGELYEADCIQIESGPPIEVVVPVTQ